MQFNEKDVRIKFGVISDVHITDDPQGQTTLYTAKALKMLKEKAGGKLDCLAIPGDLTQWGRPAQCEMFNKVFSENLDAKETPLIYCSGNHDNFVNVYDKAGLELFEYRMPKLIDPANFAKDISKDAPLNCRHAVVNGIHFLCVNASDYVVPNKPYTPEVVAWFEENLALAEEQDPGMPIIVLSHISVTNTVCGSNFNTGYYLNLMWHDQALRSVLEKHPQIIYISGHLHYSANGADSIMQDGFTAINCPPIGYLVTDFGFYNLQKGIGAIPEEATDHPAGLLIEVDGNGTAKVTRYDFGLEQQIREPWVVPNPVTSGETPYSLHRRNIAPADFPVKDLAVKLQPTTEGKANLSIDFSAATCDTDIFFYEVELIKDKVVYDIRRYMSDYHKFAKIEDCAKQIHIDCGEVETGKEFWVAVTPYDIWRNPGVTERVMLQNL